LPISNPLSSARYSPHQHVHTALAFLLYSGTAELNGAPPIPQATTPRRGLMMFARPGRAPSVTREPAEER
jgi:hypothetical protein